MTGGLADRPGGIERLDAEPQQDAAQPGHVRLHDVDTGAVAGAQVAAGLRDALAALLTPGPDGPEPNRLSLLSRWKILDNLRRSLVEPAWLLFLLAGWLLLPGQPLRWTLLALGIWLARVT